MKVNELIKILEQKNQNAEVGVSSTCRYGWVMKAVGVCEVLGDDVVTIDVGEETLGEEEVYFVEPPVDKV